MYEMIVPETLSPFMFLYGCKHIQTHSVTLFCILPFQNALEFNYTEESLGMIEDGDLFVWQLVEDLAKPYSITSTL